MTTGISAHDRAQTIRRAIDPTTRPEDLARPGHVFPLRCRPGGVLERRGHTEAAVDLASLAGLGRSGVICEILKEDGSMARVPGLVRFCSRHHLKMVAIADLVRNHDRLKHAERSTSHRVAVGISKETAKAIPSLPNSYRDRRPVEASFAAARY